MIKGAGTLRTVRTRWWGFFNTYCLVGFPWFWPAGAPSVPVMVAARRMARRNFGRNHHPLYRVLAQVITAMVWPPAALMHLWQTRCIEGPNSCADQASSWGAVECPEAQRLAERLLCLCAVATEPSS